MKICRQRKLNYCVFSRQRNGYEKNLRDWFKLIYQVLFGDIDGPRMGFFVSFFGVKETTN